MDTEKKKSKEMEDECPPCHRPSCFDNEFIKSLMNKLESGGSKELTVQEIFTILGSIGIDE